MDDFLAKSKAPPCASFADTADVVAKVAFKMFLGVPALVGSWSSDRRTFSLVFSDNPLAEFTELPEKWGEVWYSNVLCGVIKGALEMVGVAACFGVLRVGWGGGVFEHEGMTRRDGRGRGRVGMGGMLEQRFLPLRLHGRCSWTCGNHRWLACALHLRWCRDPGGLLRSSVLYALRVLTFCYIFVLPRYPLPPPPVFPLPRLPFPSPPRALSRLPPPVHPPPRTPVCRSRWRSTPALSAARSAGRTSTRSA